MNETPYPIELETWTTTRAGEQVFIRPVRGDDAATLRRELDDADDETLYQRFFTPRPQLDDAAIDYLTHLDYRRRLALAVFSDTGEPIAVGRYEGLGDTTAAEVAIVVKPHWRKKGIAQLLLDRLAEIAVENGFERFEAFCLDDNKAALALLAAAGYDVEKPDGGIVAGHKALVADDAATPTSNVGCRSGGEGGI